MKWLGCALSAIDTALDLRRECCNSASLDMSMIVKAAHTVAGKVPSGYCTTQALARHVITAVHRNDVTHTVQRRGFTAHICMLSQAYKTAAAVPVHQQHVLPLCNSRACNYTASWVLAGLHKPSVAFGAQSLPEI